MIAMKQYMVFAFAGHDIIGGMGDFQVDFDTLQEAVDWIEKDRKGNRHTDWEVYDIRAKEQVYAL